MECFGLEGTLKPIQQFHPLPQIWILDQIAPSPVQPGLSLHYNLYLLGIKDFRVSCSIFMYAKSIISTYST